MNKKQIKNSIFSLILGAALIISSVLAFMTATEKKNNVFTVGKASIELQESSNWVLDEDDGKYYTTTGVTNPSAKVLKEPIITNSGKQEVCAYMIVGIPKADMVLADDNGLTLNNGNIQRDVEMFQLLNDNEEIGINEGWKYLSAVDYDWLGNKDTTNYYLYYYDSALAPEEETTSLFKYAKCTNYVGDLNSGNYCTFFRTKNEYDRMVNYQVNGDIYGDDCVELSTTSYTVKVDEGDHEDATTEFITLASDPVKKSTFAQCGMAQFAVTLNNSVIISPSDYSSGYILDYGKAINPETYIYNTNSEAGFYENGPVSTQQEYINNMSNVLNTESYDIACGDVNTGVNGGRFMISGILVPVAINLYEDVVTDSGVSIPKGLYSIHYSKDTSKILATGPANPDNAAYFTRDLKDYIAVDGLNFVFFSIKLDTIPTTEPSKHELPVYAYAMQTAGIDYSNPLATFNKYFGGDSE